MPGASEAKGGAESIAVLGGDGDEADAGMAGYGAEEGRVRLLENAEDGQLTVQRGKDCGGELLRAGFGGPQLVHEQHVAAAVFEGCHAQRVEAFRGVRAAVEQEIVRSGRGVRHRRAYA